MKVIIQRVLNAKCTVEEKVTGSIDNGYMLLIGFGKCDENITVDTLNKVCKKISNMRIFSDADGKMNKSIHDVNGSILAISQFTLYANPYEGNRPSFVDSLNAEKANLLYHEFMDILRNEYNIHVEEGIFGADMKLDIVCDGPVTITLEY